MRTVVYSETGRRLLQCLFVVAFTSTVIVVVPGTVTADEHEHTQSVELAGNGTAEDPYVVTSVAEWNAINDDLDAHYVLGNDITASDRNREDRPDELQMIGGWREDAENFAGTLDGRGHTIRGVETPLFYENEGTIRDLRLDTMTIRWHGTTMVPVRPLGAVAQTNTGTILNLTVTDLTARGGPGSVGGIVGVNRGGTIANIRVTEATLEGDETGGIVGRTEGGTLTAVTVEAEIDGWTGGGIAGESNGTTIQMARASATVAGEDRAGGLVGTATATRIENSLSVSETDGPTAGGVVGSVGNGSSAESTYWDRTVGDQTAAGNGSISVTGLSTARLTGDAVRANTDLAFPGQWWLTDRYPVPSAVIGGGERTTLGNVTVAGEGTESNPYVITTVEQLQAMHADLDGHYVLGNDIDASETAQWKRQRSGDTERGWTPVGTNVTRPGESLPDTAVFTGTLDGRNHSIRGLVIDQQDGRHQMGLIGVNRGTIRNLTLQGVAVRTHDPRNYAGHEPAGALAGTNQGTISRVTVRDGIVSDRRAGGLVGENRGGTITGGTVANVTVRADTGGGVVAIHSAGRIERVTARGLSVSGDTVGGITGRQFEGLLGLAASSGNISGDVAGGLVGEGKDGTVDLTRTTATVEGETVAGGLIGNSSGMVLKRSYAAGETSTNRTAGGIAGRAVDTDATSLYWDRQTTGQSEPTGEGLIDAKGYPTANLTGNDAVRTMDGFDFAHDWETTVGYPAVRSEQNAPVSEDESAFDVEMTSIENPVVSGEQARIRLRISRRGPGQITASPDVAVGERELDLGEYTVDPGEQRTVNLSWNTTSPGLQPIVIDGEHRGELIVLSKPQLTVSGIDGPTTVTAGEEFEVSATVANTGEANTTAALTTAFDGDELASRELSIAGGRQREVTVRQAVETATTGELVIETPDDRASTTLTVEARSGANNGTGADANSTDGTGTENNSTNGTREESSTNRTGADTESANGTDSADESGPGFGAVVAALAALLFASRAR